MKQFVILCTPRGYKQSWFLGAVGNQWTRLRMEARLFSSQIDAEVVCTRVGKGLEDRVRVYEYDMVSAQGEV